MQGGPATTPDCCSPAASPRPVLVLGLGNILFADKGVGVHVVERLRQRYAIPDAIDVLDGSSARRVRYRDIVGREHLIVVDAVDSHSPPGTLVTLEHDAVPAFFRGKISQQQMALSDILTALHISGAKPTDVTLIGIQPERLGSGLALSALVSDQLDALLQQLVAVLERLGYRLRPRDDWHSPGAATERSASEPAPACDTNSGTP